MSLNAVNGNFFSDSFITNNLSDFNEFLRLSTLSAQRLLEGKDYSKQDVVIKKMLTIFEALDYIGITEKEVEALQDCLNSFRMKNPTVVEFTFSEDFIQLYCSSFKEYLKLSTHSAKRIVAGKQPGTQEERSERLITILRSLYVGNLTAKEIESLQYCLLLLNRTLRDRNLSAIYTPDGCPPESEEYFINAFGGLFTLTGQDVTFQIAISIEAEYGSFALNGQDVTFQIAISIEAEYGSFTLNGQDVTLTHYVEPTYYDHRRGNTPSATECSVCPPSYGSGFFYTAPGDTIPTIGMVVYTDSSLTTPFNGGDQWWAIEWDGPSSSTVDGILVGADGVVDDFHICSVDCP